MRISGGQAWRYFTYCNQTIDLDLPVFESIQDIRQFKCIIETAAVVFQTTVHFFSLVLRQELCGTRIVI